MFHFRTLAFYILLFCGVGMMRGFSDDMSIKALQKKLADQEARLDALKLKIAKQDGEALNLHPGVYYPELQGRGLRHPILVSRKYIYHQGMIKRPEYGEQKNNDGGPVVPFAGPLGIYSPTCEVQSKWGGEQKSHEMQIGTVQSMVH